MSDVEQKPDLAALHRLAYSQDGLFATRQAQERGVSAQLLAHHARSGRFQRMRQGLYRLSDYPAGEHDEIRAAWLTVGMERAVVSHESALVLHGLSDVLPNTVHLLVSREHRGVRAPSGVTLHTATAPIPDGHIATRHGIRVTTPARTIVARDAPQQRNRSFLRKDFAYIFERFHSHVCDGPDHAHGVLIFDEQDKALSRNLLDQMRRYFIDTARGCERAKRLIPMPFFVHSELTPAIQLADLVAYITNWGLRTQRMAEPACDELRPLAGKVFALRYQQRRRRGMPIAKRIAKAPRRRSGISYIDDLRPRGERDEEALELYAVRA